jgi:hypothetical protein
MKKVITLLLITVIALTVKAQQNDHTEWKKKRYEHFKERTISKTYAASGNSLHIDNSFGDVIVTTWDRNEIKVDVHIEASSTDKEIAEKTFNNLDVTESKDGNTIKFKTTTEKNKGNNWSCKNCSNTMNITYTIQIPAGNTLKIENSFGGIKIPDYNGPVSLTSKFGSLTTGSLAKAEKLWVEFGKANIKSISNINATFKFSTVTVENLSGNNKVIMEFCSSSRINIDNDLTSLTLNNSYSTVNLRPASNLSASYHIRTSFGSVKDRSNANIQRTDKPDQYGPDSDRTYEGKSGSGSAKIEIKSSFGNIIIGEATAEEMKDKKDAKGKAEIKI